MYGQTSTNEESISFEIDTINTSVACGDQYGTSWTGHGNVNCNSGWANEKNAVVRIEIPLSGGGCDYCTGALVNTTKGENNDKHYILTAAHCLKSSPNGWKFYWHYESPVCRPSQKPQHLIYTQGAKEVAKHVGHGTVDFVLLELYHDPAEAWDITPYYLGWDRGSTQNSATVIYHPAGDIKKLRTISSFLPPDPVYIPTWFWRHTGTDEKALEGGSSGAPLLNSSRKIIGHVCRYTPMGNQHGKYWEFDSGKFLSAWEGVTNSPNSTNRLKDWLDPDGTGVTTLDGRSLVCQKTIRLQHSLPRSNYHAVDSIISKQVISSGTVSYKAGTEVRLLEGFHAKSGSNFSAQIEELDCNSTNAPSFSSPKGGDPDHIITEIPDFSLSQPQIPYQINLLPNPNNGAFQLETNFPLAEIEMFKVINLLGTTIYETKHLPSNAIQLPTYAQGVHFVVLFLKDGTVLTQKMMIRQ